MQTKQGSWVGIWLGSLYNWTVVVAATFWPCLKIARRRLFAEGVPGQRETASSMFVSGIRIPTLLLKVWTGTVGIIEESRITQVHPSGTIEFAVPTCRQSNPILESSCASEKTSVDAVLKVERPLLTAHNRKRTISSDSLSGAKPGRRISRFSSSLHKSLALGIIERVAPVEGHPLMCSGTTWARYSVSTVAEAKRVPEKATMMSCTALLVATWSKQATIIVIIHVNRLRFSSSFFGPCGSRSILRPFCSRTILWLYRLSKATGSTSPRLKVSSETLRKSNKAESRKFAVSHVMICRPAPARTATSPREIPQLASWKDLLHKRATS